MAIVIGAGLTGCVAARVLAERGAAVRVWEKEPQIGGALLDTPDGQGAYIHQFGPHIFHTNSERVYQFITRFSEWNNFRHRVLAEIAGELCPVPFNLTSIEQCFTPAIAARYAQRLRERVGFGETISIGELRAFADDDLRELADFIYENVFLNYTKKQWGMTPEQLGGDAMKRVPVRCSFDDGYFADRYQLMPTRGYTEFLRNLLAHPNIEVCVGRRPDLRADAEQGRIFLDGAALNDVVIYTGSLDELFAYQFGELPYRTLKFEIKTVSYPFQPVAVVNYPNDPAVTRISEFAHFYPTEKYQVSTIAYEYPLAYERGSPHAPYYPIPLSGNLEIYQHYRREAQKIPALYPAGRLGGYQYLNMDAAILDGIAAAEKIFKGA